MLDFVKKGRKKRPSQIYLRDYWGQGLKERIEAAYAVHTAEAKEAGKKEDYFIAFMNKKAAEFFETEVEEVKEHVLEISKQESGTEGDALDETEEQQRVRRVEAMEA